MLFVHLSFLDLLQTALEKVFDEILAPVLVKVFNYLVSMLGKQLWSLLSDLVLDGFVLLLKGINFLENMFNLFSGLAVVEAEIDGKKQTTSLINYIFGLSGISKALFAITLIAAVMAFLFALYATGKSMADLPFDDKAAPITTVLRNGFKSAITFMIIPIFCVFLLQLSSAILDQTIIAFQGVQQESGLPTNAGIDDILFISCAQDAIKAKDEKGIADVTNKYGAKHNYQNRKEVKKAFNIEKIDYLPGYISCAFIAFILLATVIMFIRRVFDLLLLYMVSPFFSASIALDGGAHFKKWKDLFIAHFFSGFGSIFAMKLFLVVMPFILQNETIKFSGAEGLTSCIRLFLIAGGAWSVFKGQNLIMQIFNPEAASVGGEAAGAGKAIAIHGAAHAVRGIGSIGSAFKQGYQGGKGGK